jgi:hypothetical protein
MSNEDNIDNLLEQLNTLRIAETEIIRKIVNARARNTIQLNTDNNNNVERDAIPINTNNELKIGDNVIILNPRRYQEDRGVICKISETRITVKPKRGIKIVRAHKNIRKIT